MGSGASTLLGIASDFHLNHDERTRYREYYLELQRTGKNPKDIVNILVKKLNAERNAGPKELPPSGTTTSTSSSSETLQQGNDITAMKVGFQTEDNGGSKPALDSNLADVTYKASKSLNGFAAWKSAKMSSKSSASTSTDEPTEPIDLFKYEPVNDDVEVDYEKLECKLCKLTFPAPVQLKRHIQYSQVHATNLRQFELKKKQADRAHKVSKMVYESLSSLHKNAHHTKQWHDAKTMAAKWKWAVHKIIIQNRILNSSQMLVRMYQLDPGKTHFNPAKVWHECNKLFWRTQESVDIMIYLHDYSDAMNIVSNQSAVIEVNGFERSCRKELGRLYLNCKMMESFLGDDVEQAMAAKNVGRRNSTTEISLDSVRKDVIVDFIIAHLEMVPVPGRAASQQLSLSEDAERVSRLKKDSSNSMEASHTLLDLVALTPAEARKMKPVDVSRMSHYSRSTKLRLVESISSNTNEARKLLVTAHAALVETEAVVDAVDALRVRDEEDPDGLIEEIANELNAMEARHLHEKHASSHRAHGHGHHGHHHQDPSGGNHHNSPQGNSLRHPKGTASKSRQSEPNIPSHLGHSASQSTHNYTPHYMQPKAVESSRPQTAIPSSESLQASTSADPRPKTAASDSAGIGGIKEKDKDKDASTTAFKAANRKKRMSL